LPKLLFIATKKEKESIKNGEISQNFKDNPKKLPQKDTYARWTKKNNINYFGCKSHIKVDSKVKSSLKTWPQVLLCTISSFGGAFGREAGLHADCAYVGKKT